MKKYLILAIIFLFSVRSYCMNKPERDSTSEVKIDDLIGKSGHNNDEWIEVIFQCVHYESHNGLLKFLLKIGIDPDSRDLSHDTLLHKICRFWKAGHKNLSLLLKYGANPNAANKFGETPLLAAIKSSPLKTIKILLAYGANPNLCDHQGLTPLMYAVIRTSSRCINRELRRAIVFLLLQSGADINLKADNGQTARDIACSKCGFGDLVPLMEKSDYKEKLDKSFLKVSHTLLTLAVRKGEEKFVQLLLKTNIDIDEQLLNGVTALMLAVAAENENIIKMLLIAGASVNIQNMDLNTSLHIAVKGGKKKIIKMLLAAGADVQISNVRGMTAIDIAYINGTAKILEILLCYENLGPLSKAIHDCDRDEVFKLIKHSKVPHLIKALFLCKSASNDLERYNLYLNIIEILVKRTKFDIEFILDKIISYRLPEVILILAKYLNYKNINFARVLAERERRRLAQVIEIKLSEITKFKFGFRESDNSNDFDNIRIIVMDYQKNIQKLKRIKKIIDLLIFVGKKKVAIPYAIDQSLEHFKKLVTYRNIKINNRVIIANKAMTPLMIAVEKNKIDVIKFLLEQGTNVNYQCKRSGETALMIAAKNGRYACVDILLANGANPDFIDHQGKCAMSYALHKNDQNIVDLLLWSQV